ncbi:type VI secretion system contractile sheath small subunit [Pseudomonas helleri]|uniref:Type VI secretion system contractile sheath small subunit n=1 Tax=Pseudomonas helleri TaxID=1608996 RepID=A0A6A7Z1H2_9PSED|nr:type VI secretion system contractile sheath small subunit [Pseudomonas helleri]MQT27620.1 hypothetical protein [Pseudomonas helleri]MQT81675.1 hypothetical protein [Pseudomonas helleri]MQU18601.1 hypothetical protein [Pseudomonas helleri]MQU28362.1 hypothetical protein [Pseudomonas helleri]
MSYSLFAQTKPALEPDLCATAPTADGPAPIDVPELSRLVKLRDALLMLKVPMTHNEGLRDVIKGRLLNNEVYERVLGKLASENPNHVSVTPP